MGKSIAVQLFNNDYRAKVKECPPVKVKVFQNLDNIPGTPGFVCQVLGQKASKSMVVSFIPIHKRGPFQAGVLIELHQRSTNCPE
jgi:hypothetical protein